MTGRLKRKLEDIGVHVQSNSSRSTENFCLIGTPLPPLEKAKDAGEFVPLWKQEVRDEQGRRRLHGAFTGGFSAGYYNTVGSKEGWTPSTFTSSRMDRASKKQARPEDFMDEEDLAELRDSKKLVDTTEEIDMLGGTQAELARRNGAGEIAKDSIANALEMLLPPAKDSVGARLLKKMGWRPGQGVGPRVTYKQLRAQDGRPIKEDEPIDEEAQKHLYARRDTKTILYHKKENTFGLGYTPGLGLSEIIQGQNEQASGSGPRLSAGFGLGALNEAEDDDVDIYDQGPIRESRHMAYDAGEAEDDDRVTIYGKKAGSAPDASVTKVAVASVTFRDGRPLVSGFMLSEKPLVEDRWFPIPDVPKGWTSDPRRVWAKDISNGQERIDGALHASTPQDHHSWQRGKTADERGSMLGETPLSTAPRSVFDYLSQKDRDRLKGLAAGLASGSTPPKQPLTSPIISIPRSDPQTAQAALKGFQPFATGSPKQLRYTAYLQSQATASDSPELKPLPEQSNEDFNRELSDYAKAAQIFKPVSGAMAGRFASASTVEMLGSTNQGLHKPTKEDYARLEEPKAEEGKKVVEESPKAHAARVGMFGPLTRETQVWQPARLLCKRFGVKDPHPDGVEGETTTTGSALRRKAPGWEAEVLTSAGVSSPTASAPAAPESKISSDSPSGSASRRNLDNIGLGEDDEQGRDTLTYERPTKDIFKAIFASDDEDSDDDEEDNKMSEPANGPTVSAALTPAKASAGSAPPAKEPPNGQVHGSLTTQRASEEKIDLTAFRPTFVRKSEREDRMKGKDKEGKWKKKKKGKLVVSFDTEEDGVQEKERKERRKEKRQKKAHADDEEDATTWVEKPPPEITKNLVIPISTEPEDESDRHQRRRKRAVDFL